MNIDYPIGIIDSGIGGLSIFREFRKLAPSESVIYFADRKYLPYGARTKTFIIKRIKLILKFLLDRYSIKLAIIACNTATVAGIDKYRSYFPHLPIIGTVPVVKTAVRLTKTGHIAVMSTHFTANSKYQQLLINKFASGIAVDNIGCPNIVSIIETGNIGKPLLNELQSTIGYLQNTDVDVLVLGCTHYPFINKQIQQVIGKKITLLDSSGAVSRHALNILGINKITSRSKTNNIEFISSNGHYEISQISSKIIGQKIIFKTVKIE